MLSAFKMEFGSEWFYFRHERTVDRDFRHHIWQVYNTHTHARTFNVKWISIQLKLVFAADELKYLYSRNTEVVLAKLLAAHYEKQHLVSLRYLSANLSCSMLVIRYILVDGEKFDESLPRIFCAAFSNCSYRWLFSQIFIIQPRA